MADPCIAETCSLTWDTGVGDSGPQHVGVVRVGAKSSIACTDTPGDPDHYGLDVKIGRGLSKDPATGAILGTPGADVESFPDTAWVDVPVTANALGWAATGANAQGATDEASLLNPLGVDAICTVEGNFSLFWAVVRNLTDPDFVAGSGGGAVNITPYNADMLVRVFASLTAATYGVAAVSAYDDISGNLKIVLPNVRQEKGDEPRFSFPYPVPAGGTIHIAGKANYQGDDQRINTAFDGTSAGGQKRGFKLRDVTATWIAAA